MFRLQTIANVMIGEINLLARLSLRYPLRYPYYTHTEHIAPKYLHTPYMYIIHTVIKEDLSYFCLILHIKVIS